MPKKPVSKTNGLDRKERLETAIWRLNVTSMGATELDMGSSGFDDDDVVAMAKFLARNPILLDLNLSNNHIVEDGARALARALRVNGSLTKLDLRDNFIDDEGVNALVSPFESLTTFPSIL